MAAITQIQLPNGDPYEITDKYALQLKNSSANYRTQMIQSGDDLNDYTTPGTYVCSDSTTANSLNNCPTTLGFKLIVMHARTTTTYCQIIIPYYLSGDASFIQYRAYNGSSWGSWHKLATTDGLDNNYVIKTGDTMTGNLNVTKFGGAWTEIKNTSNDYAVDVWAASDRVGLYNNTTGNTGWITYSNSSGNYFNGLANSATSDADGNNITDTYVNKTGDTMTGQLTITRAGANDLTINNTSSTAGETGIYLNNARGQAWLGLTNAAVGLWVNASASPTGSNLYLVRATTSTAYLFNHQVTTGSTGLVRGIVLGTATATTSNTGVGDIYFRYS